MGNGMRKKFRKLFGIDIRSLALFRIGLGLILLVDLFLRLQDLNVHYSDEGVLPRDVLIANHIGPWNVSLHLFNGTWQLQLVLFILAIFFALALLIGYKTRLATILSWFFLISLHTRNPLIVQGGDFVLRVLLFWAMFLPLNACWSIDQWLSKKPFSKRIFSAATAALLLQVCFIYWFTALLKTDATWKQEGTAVWYALSIEQLSTSFGQMLLQYPSLLKALTFATLYLEVFGPFLAFSPFWTGPLRFATVMMFIFFHLVGLNLTMELGLFPYVCSVAWIVFIPKWFWDLFCTRAQIADPNNAWAPSRLSNVLAVFFLVYIFLGNIRSLGYSDPIIPSELHTLDSLLKIKQNWNMFSPSPYRVDGWYVIPAKLRDGTEVDLFNNGSPVSWEKPPLLSATYKNERWRLYMMNLFDDEDDVTLLNYAKYMCRQWNRSHSGEKHLVSFDIAFMLKRNSFENPSFTYGKTILWHHKCDD